MAYTPMTLVDSLGKRNAKNRIPNVPRWWTYSTTDAVATVRAANYITDAKYRGMQAGDIVAVVVYSAGVPSVTQIMSVLSVGASGADLTDGTAITMTNS